MPHRVLFYSRLYPAIISSFHAFHCLNDLVKAPGYISIIVLFVRDNTVTAIFDTIVDISKSPAAPVTKGIKRAVAEQAVEFLRINPGVAGKELACCVSKKSKRLSVPILALWIFFCSIVFHQNSSISSGRKPQP